MVNKIHAEEEEEEEEQYHVGKLEQASLPLMSGLADGWFTAEVITKARVDETGDWVS